jgi:hypothetical protein
MQLTRLKRFGQAGEQFARALVHAPLAHTTFQQLCRTDMAIAVATTLGAVITQAPCGVENGFSRANVKNGATGLQGNFHVHVF